MANVDKIIKSKYQPKQTNVVWVDLSGETPVEKYFINGRWVAISGGGGGGDTPKTIYVEKLIPFSPRPQDNLTSEQVESLNVGDLVITTTNPNTLYVCSQIFTYEHNGNLYNVKALSSVTFYDAYKTITAEELPYVKNVYYLNNVGSSWACVQALAIDPNTLAQKIRVYTQQGSFGMYPNTLYNFGELTGDTTFAMAAATDNTIANVWTWTFSTGSTAPTITWPAKITMWSDGDAPEIEANKYYEVSVMNGVGTVISADIPQEEETEVEP